MEMIYLTKIEPWTKIKSNFPQNKTKKIKTSRKNQHCTGHEMSVDARRKIEKGLNSSHKGRDEREEW